ncbi:MAG: glycosyl transferase [Flavobacteriaceae bacterium]|nr:glycosyl transferase [Flavobacteriaceae bacterium]MBL6684190.1 glycosyl transferase [Flavobacteriaceae bacterium]
MKILYAVQSTGNGHIVRANELIKILKKRAEVDVLISGTQSSLKLKHEIKYQYKGLSFVFGKRGGIDFLKTLKSFNPITFFKEIYICPVKQYDLIINDFEPISAWASLLKRKTNCVASSHQFSLLSHKVPKGSKVNLIQSFILKYYAPVKKGYGYHFKKYDKNIFFPIIKSHLRKKEIKSGSHITIYLPSYSDEYLYNIFSKIYKKQWHVFSPYTKHKYRRGNILFFPTGYEQFEESLLSCSGVMCNSGFETPSEALFLGKKLLVIPMKNQFEQKMNAIALEEIGVNVLQKLNINSINKIRKWIKKGNPIRMSYPDENKKIIDKILIDYIREKSGKKISKNLKHFINQRDTIF